MSVLELLKATTKGQNILQEFKLFKKIDTRSICDLIIYYEFDMTKSYR